MLRRGQFEPRVPRDAYIYPVLVTFDTLCDNAQLTQWLIDRCRTLGFLQQPGVAPLTVAVVEDFERLISAPAHNKSPTHVLKSRSSKYLMNERLDVVLYANDVPPRLPSARSEYVDFIRRIVRRLKQWQIDEIAHELASITVGVSVAMEPSDQSETARSCATILGKT